MSSSKACGLLEDTVILVVSESTSTTMPFFNHKMKGNGKPLTAQNKVAEVFRVLLTEDDEAWTLGGTA